MTPWHSGPGRAAYPWRQMSTVRCVPLVTVGWILTPCTGLQRPWWLRLWSRQLPTSTTVSPSAFRAARKRAALIGGAMSGPFLRAGLTGPAADDQLPVLPVDGEGVALHPRRGMRIRPQHDHDAVALRPVRRHLVEGADVQRHVMPRAGDVVALERGDPPPRSGRALAGVGVVRPQVVAHADRVAGLPPVSPGV